MADDEESSSHNKKQMNDKEKKLWQDLKIDFHLEAFKFPDNKIYGVVNIIPESSRKLIKKFVLVVNKINRIEFDRDYTTLSAAGLNTNKKHPSAYIEAIPNNIKWADEPKTSEICYFYFTGEVFTLSPTISFDWPNDEDSKPRLIIKWYHIGDKNAHRYILYLDDVEIQNIRQKLIDDAFGVTISSFQCGEKHTFQLVARLNNGKETYRSDFIEFTVPDKIPDNGEEIEFITVSNEPAPPNLPVIIAVDKDKREEDRNQNKNQLLEQKPKQKNNEDNKMSTCCDQLPHAIFPGIEHYFRNINSKLSSSLTSQKQSSNNNKITVSSKKTDEETDDDNDVIMSNN